MTESIESVRHSLSHLLAAAVLEIWPDAKLGIGPIIENGFYYDFELPETISPDRLVELEKKMKHYVKQNLAFNRSEATPDEAHKMEAGQRFKIELIEDLAKGDQSISFYTSGKFVDLCAGPHVTSTKEINPAAFKLTKIAGAYWRGDEKKPMLTRIYGVAFGTKEELADYLKRLEEMAARDHRKIGKEQGLWTFSDLVGAGLPMFTPKGTVLRTELFNSLFEVSKRYGMQPVTIPHLAKRKLYEISGHAEKFGDELIAVHSHYDEFVLKPVNCPHHTQIYASEPRSYRDLPIRYMESTMQYRDERPGEISGLTRVRSITCDDGHIFCRIDQVEDEAKLIAQIVKEFYGYFGMWGKHWVSLSVRDPQKLDAYIGDEVGWQKAEAMLKQVSDDMSLDAKRMEGEAALYGPKLDFIFADALGRETQLATIQIDFAMPKRFGLEYVDQTGKKQTPVMIHRAILGSYERFLALLIEHYAGSFPIWLSPVQVKLLSVSDAHIEPMQTLTAELRDKGIRVELDIANETIGHKIRQASVEKVPYLLVFGDKEATTNTLSVRDRGSRDTRTISRADFIKEVTTKIISRSA
jgi:threonyl-tRNA synthetase